MTRRAMLMLAVILTGFGPLFVPTPAHASTTISATFTGEEVLPKLARAHQKAVRALRRARAMAGSVKRPEAIAELTRARAELEEMVRTTASLLRSARTRIAVYGDAGTRVTRNDILAHLRRGENWRLREIHIWQRDGQLLWDKSAPRGGFDDRRSRSSPPPVHRTRPAPGGSGYGLPPSSNPGGGLAPLDYDEVRNLWKPGKGKKKTPARVFGF